jgi:Family of unknown function (DUF5681)
MSANKPPKRAPTGDYPVGYAKPPKATQFQPKQSGNPDGRPKGRPTLDEIVLEEAARIAKVKVGDKILHIDKDRALMRKAFDMPLQGNLHALRFVTARLALAQSAAGTMADPEEPLTEEELAVIKIISKEPGK